MQKEQIQDGAEPVEPALTSLFHLLQKQRMCGQLGLSVLFWLLVHLCILFSLIPSACQAVSPRLCAPQIRRRPFVVRWWRFVSGEDIWLCII